MVGSGSFPSSADQEVYIMRKMNRLQNIHDSTIKKLIDYQREIIESKAEFEAEIFELKLLIKNFCCSHCGSHSNLEPLREYQTLVPFLTEKKSNDDISSSNNYLTESKLDSTSEVSPSSPATLKESMLDVECNYPIYRSPPFGKRKNVITRSNSKTLLSTFSSPKTPVKDSARTCSLNKTCDSKRMTLLAKSAKEESDDRERFFPKSMIAADLTSTIAQDNSNSFSLNNSSERFPTYMSPLKKKSSQINVTVCEPKVLINDGELIPNFKKITYRKDSKEHKIIIALCKEWKPRIVYRLRTIIKGYFTRKLYNSEQVKTIKLDFKEYNRLLVNSDFTDEEMDVRFMNKLKEKIKKCREQIHEIFFEYTKAQQLKLVLKDDITNNSKQSSSFFSFLNRSRKENKSASEKKRFLNKK